MTLFQNSYWNLKSHPSLTGTILDFHNPVNPIVKFMNVSHTKNLFSNLDKEAKDVKMSVTSLDLDTF